MARATEARARRLFRSRERFFRRNVELMAEHYGDPNASVLLDRTLRQPNRGGNWKRGVYTATSWSPGYSISEVNSRAVDGAFAMSHRPRDTTIRRADRLILETGRRRARFVVELATLGRRDAQDALDFVAVQA